ncbi:MAG TPA: STAS domain-containing protein [Allosphingosinicella sp.]|nr:STAS domain-containing protein [Allosphingosinicella sp.]
MQIQFSDEGERLVARPLGRLEAADGAAFVAAVEDRLQAGTRSVTIDLDQLDFINFGGIRAVLRLARSLKRGDRRVDFAHGGEAVREMLDQAGLDDIFAFTPPYPSNRGRRDENRTP